MGSHARPPAHNGPQGEARKGKYLFPQAVPGQLDKDRFVETCGWEMRGRETR